ncbi:MAG: NAD(P)H-dependent oxidoreductase [Candidatus Gracilibacteria bacterium]|nr:NAD(P)H-dependent oxidoreductase [Candidatus Gracilibacteria bacterium]
MIVIIFCHPSHQSHNGETLNRITETLKKKRKDFEVIDLYKQNFSACLSPVEYNRIRERIHETDKDVLKMQEKIKKAKTLIFIYPTWWYNMPGRLKGFMDRVFTPGFAYNFKPVPSWQLWGANILSFIPGLRYLMQPYSANGHLRDKKALIFRTYGGPALGRRVFGNGAHKVLEQNILRFCGLTNITTHELYNIDKREFSESDHKKYLEKVELLCKKA